MDCVRSVCLSPFLIRVKVHSATSVHTGTFDQHSFHFTFIQFHELQGSQKEQKCTKNLNLYTVRFLIYVLVLKMLKPTFFLQNVFSQNSSYISFVSLNISKTVPSKYNRNSAYNRNLLSVSITQIQIFPAILSPAIFRAG